MIKVRIGNILDSKARTLVNTVNCVGIMGKGIALDFKTKYPDMYQQYQKKCERNEVKPGEPYIYTDLNGTRIVNFPTKNHWKDYSNMDDVIKGLDIFIKKYKEWGIKSVAFPPLGCGNGGLDWEYVGPIMYNKLKDLDIDIELYAPYGTKEEQLTEKFLTRDVDINFIKKKYRQKVKPEWIVLLKAVENLNMRPYANPVGRVIFQKICFVGDQLNLVDFNFQKGSYGPFSTEINKAKVTMSNNNIIREEKRGRMFVVQLGDEYDTFKNRYKDEILKNQDKINMITDLFQRIKSTDQAEEVSSVLWVERELKSKNSNA
ncbi:MAG: macro domain-containing protein, partial [Euryarchaeota archaeon]|nr:macro domain-containing protein [Euryarchaeota archaeon]